MSCALDTLFAAYSSADAPGMAVGAAVEGKTVFRRAFGAAHVELGVANTIQTRFPIGSVTKQMTAMAALALDADGVLDLRSGVRRWLPELPALDGEPTLLDLLTHGSGYRCYLDASFADGFALKPHGAALAFQVRQTGTNAPPGRTQVYNNSGYHLVSLAIERACGRPFEAVLRERLFDPLGMARTLSVRGDWPVVSGTAERYVALPEGGWRRGVNVSDERLGDGSVVSTVDDMLRWLAALRAGQASQGLWRRLAAPVPAPDGAPSRYGLGLRVDRWRGVLTLGHGGHVMGATSAALTIPDRALDIVVLANCHAPTERLARDVAAALLGDRLEQAPEPPRAERFPALRGAFHAAETGKVLRFVDLDGVLSLAVNEGPGAPLQAAEVDGALPFALPTPTDTLRVIDVTGERLRVRDDGHVATYRKLTAPVPEAARVLEAAAGAYRCDDLGATLRLVPGDAANLAADELVLDCVGEYGRNQLLLRPIAPDLLAARHSVMPFAAIVALVRDGGRVAGLTVTTARTRRLPFVRIAP